MNYVENVQYIEEIINNVLLKLGQSMLFENSDFKPRGPQYDDYVELDLNKTDSICMKIEIYYNGLKIFIGNFPEAYDYDIEYIRANEDLIRNIIEMIFTTTIKQEFCGKSYSKLSFIDDGQNTIKTITYKRGFLGLFNYKGKDCREEIYSPIYTR